MIKFKRTKLCIYIGLGQILFEIEMEKFSADYLSEI